MRNFLVGFLFILFIGASAIAQCPQLSLDEPAEKVKKGDTVVFTVQVTGGDSKVVPKFEWQVSAGKIKKGQGEASIEVETAGMEAGLLTASVSVSGYRTNCEYASATVAILSPIGNVAKKQDEFTMLRISEERARLAAFASLLQEDPNLVGYVIAYGDKKSKPGDTKAGLARMREYLNKTNGIETERIAVIDGGIRKIAAVELWAATQEAAPPTPTPEKP